MKEHAGYDMDAVIITGDLDRRPSRVSDFQAENQALNSLAEAMSNSPDTVFQRLVEVAMELTGSDSAGISLLEPGGENGAFRWVATAGAWSPYRDKTMPREASPCGEVIAREAVLLMKNPARLFPALLQAEPGISEGLFAPFYISGVPVGTVWTIKHSPNNHFEAEDARIIKSLARFASAAHQTVQALQLAKSSEQRAELRFQQLVTLAEVSSEFFGTCDMEFMPIYGNAAAMRMVGLTDLEQVQRTPLQEFFFPEDLAFITEEFLPRVVREGQAKVEIRFRHFVTGEPVWVDYSLVVLKDETGRATGLGTVTHDLTERKRAEVALRVSEARFRALATVGSSSIYRMSPDWREMRHLDGAAFLADSDEPTADWVDTYIPSDERSRVREAIHRAIGAKDVFELEHRVLRADGTVGWTFSRAIPLFDDVGEISEWFGAATDVTARVKADQSFTRLFRASPAPFLVVKPDAPRFTIAEVNDAYLSATMRTRDEVVGRGIFEAYPDNPSDETTGSVSTLRASLEHVLASRQPNTLPRLKYDVARSDGTFEERWWSPVNSVVLDDDGEVEALIHNANDVTEERRAAVLLRESEVRQTFLLQLSDALRPLSDAAEILATTTHLLGKHIGADRVMYAEVDGELGAETGTIRGQYVRPSSGGTPSAAPFPERFAFCPFGTHTMAARHRGETLVVANIDTNPGFADLERTAWAVADVRAAVVAALAKGGRLVAEFGVHATAPRDWTKAEVSLVEEVAERSWAAVERARAEAALRDSEARFREFSEASTNILWIRNAATMRMEFASPAFDRIYGIAGPDRGGDPGLRAWARLIEPKSRKTALANFRRVRAGERIEAELQARRATDGSLRWVRNTDFPMFDAAGRVTRIAGLGEDITDLKAAEHALADAEARQRTLMEGIPQLVWRSRDEGLWTWASPQWLEFTGQGQEESHGMGWLDTVHVDDRAATTLAWEQARSHGRLDVEYRVRRAADGAWVWHHTRSAPVLDAEGRILEWLGTCTDVQDLRELQERQKVLVGELQHRTRNVIGIVRSIAEKTVRESADLADFRARFTDRLDSLARVQGLLSRLNEHDRVSFDELIEAELSAMDAAGERVTLVGPVGVRLRSSTVQTLAMALHELATNAVKYGALGQASAGARLAITWSLEPIGPRDQPWLHVDWRESGVQMASDGAPPRGGGHGRELIERALPYQLGAKTSYSLGPDGVHCTISMPVSADEPVGMQV